MQEIEKTEKFSEFYKTGLNDEQIKSRVSKGLVNKDTSVKTKTNKEIFLKHFFSFFNMLNIFLAGLIIVVAITQRVEFIDAFKNILFLGVIFSNTAIGTFQEIRSKKIVDKLNIISQSKALLIRNSQKVSVPISDIVLDDVAFFGIGGQIYADCIILNGQVELNESLLTGESDSVLKKEGDILLSGSFVVSGSCNAKVIKVGLDNYANQIVKKTKYIKKTNSQIVKSLDILIKSIGVVLIPLGIILFCRQYFILGVQLENAVFKAVAAVISMIPEGLVLLTSLVFAASVIRLSKHKTLVQELYAIESLARVDVLCLDKTGTITKGEMQVDEIIPVKCDISQMETALSTISKSLKGENATIDAVYDKFKNVKALNFVKNISFSSKRKWSAVCTENFCYILGAGDFIFKDNINDIKAKENEYSKKGKRVLSLAKTSDQITKNILPDDLELLGFIIISDKIRENAKETLEFFAKQNVDIKLISGDNPVTVASTAKLAGLENAENFVDASKINDEKELEKAVLENKVFGRVSPEQKLEIIKILQKNGHTVGMVGDGVNDVLALKEADCSIAMAAGSDAARAVSNLVLLESDFSAVPLIVAEGRRAINNLQRSASLFLSKTIYAALLSVLFIFVSFSYPFEPVHVTLISCLTIGIPSFVLALEQNKQLVKGDFLKNVLKKALPTGISIFLSVIMVLLLSLFVNFTAKEISTVAVLVSVSLAFRLLVCISMPFNKLRLALLAFLFILFFVLFFAFSALFDFAVLSVSMIISVVLIVAFFVCLLKMLKL